LKSFQTFFLLYFSAFPAFARISWPFSTLFLMRQNDTVLALAFHLSGMLGQTVYAFSRTYIHDFLANDGLYSIGYHSIYTEMANIQSLFRRIRNMAFFN
jgi:hypothetical protein